MRVIPVFLRVVAGPLLSAFVIFSSATGASAQESGAQKPTVVKPDASDKTEAQQSTLVFRKAWAGHKPAVLPQSKLIVRANNKNGASSEASEDSHNPVRYPGDLVYHGGAVVEFVQSHDIYLLPGGSCSSASCWAIRKAFSGRLPKASLST